MPKANSTGQAVTIFVSFVLQLSTIALAILLLLAGDVERNPGPSLSEKDIRTLVNELKPVISKYYELGLQLGIQAAQIEVIEKDHPLTERRLTEVLLFWLRGNTDVPTCWKSIIDALIHLDRKQLAEELGEKYCVCKTELATPGPTLLQEYGGKIPLPVLDTSLLDDTEKQRCQKLSADIEKLSQKFQDLFDSISTSLEERKIPISKIVAKIRTFQAFEPVYGSVEDSRPILEHRMAELRNAKSIDDVMFIIGAYSSFFNYHLVERIIKSLGTDEDKKQLSQYEEKYRCFAECMVYECPTKFKETADHHTRKFMVKVDDSFEKCTLSHLKRFINKLSEVLKLSEGTLLLESIRRGCLELTLQSPLFVYESIFPLSSDQESALAALGVIKISAGDYQYPHHTQDEPDTDDNDDKPDDGSGLGGGRGDSGIDTLTTILSELSELSEEVTELDSYYIRYLDPYYIDHDLGQKREKRTMKEFMTPLGIAAYHGHLAYVKMLVNSKLFNPSQINNALHYAVRGHQLNVLKYLIEELGCSHSILDPFGKTPLHTACKQGDLETVKYLVLDQKVDPMCEDEEYGITPLHAACIGGNIDVVRLLVSEMSTYSSIKEIAEEKAKIGDTSLHFAAANGHLPIVKYLLSELKCDPNIRGQYRMTPLHHAAYYGHVHILKYLINIMHCNPSVLDGKKRTPLFCAAENNLDTVKFLHQKGCNPRQRDFNGDIPLHMSALKGKVEIVKYFISELNCDPNTKNKDGLTPLHVAAYGGNIQVMEYLIDENKCTLSERNSLGETPLHVAAARGCLNVLKFLVLNKHCDPLLKTSQGSTPLHISAANGHMDIIRFLVSELKCDPNIRGQDKTTPLHSAALNGEVQIMKFLINDCDCACSPKDVFGSTPLHCAAKNGHLDAVKLLIESGCDPNCTDNELLTPLHSASLDKQNEVVEFFIKDLNCDPMISSKSNITPLHIAAATGNLSLLKFLLRNKKCLPSDGLRLLHIATELGHHNIVQFLVSECDNDPNTITHNTHGQTSLHEASISGQDKFLENQFESSTKIPNTSKLVPQHYNSSVDQDLQQRAQCHKLEDEGRNTKASAMDRELLYAVCPISIKLRKGEDPLQNIHYFPPFGNLPEEWEIKEYCTRRDGVNWLFMAEISDDSNSQTSGSGFWNETLVCDRSGKDKIPVLFYPAEGYRKHDFSSPLKKSHTLFVQEATKHHFSDERIGLRIENLSTFFVVPCRMKDLFALSEVYYKCKDMKCWICGKTDNNLKKCSACKVARYCSKECQATDWKKHHRRLCKVMPYFIELTELYM